MRQRSVRRFGANEIFSYFSCVSVSVCDCAAKTVENVDHGSDIDVITALIFDEIRKSTLQLHGDQTIPIASIHLIYC